MVIETWMSSETGEIPARAAGQLATAAADYRKGGQMLRALDPPFVATVGRGSSAHAAVWARGIVELATGVPVLPLAMSVPSVYGRTLKLGGGACIGVSQSGRSDDFLAVMSMARGAGATCFALTNDPDAPVLERDVFELPIAAGPEHAVSATKSFTGSLVAFAALVQAWTEDADLAAALDRLAADLERALSRDWTSMFDPLSSASSVYTIGRGPSLGIAAEAALKLKETCEIHAESYSAAEVLHGPIQLAVGDLTAIIFASDDESRASLQTAASRLAAADATVVVADPRGEMRLESDAGVELPVARTGHRWLDSISQITSFYRAVELLARDRGLDPDRPSQLAKVTRTR